MRICYIGKDGGKDSTVWGFWLIEIKQFFSVAFLCFENGSRNAYHSHAFNAVSWVLRGHLEEDLLLTPDRLTHRTYKASLRPILTRREDMHRVTSRGRTGVLTFRGPWRNTWREYLPETDRALTLTHGRQEVNA